mmetsp:Transcript_14168/g.24987  ORF Transcript_14168/g.24987 Transcript_14168/m.24987 type:complete len:112 (-) Transcript_14168:949-1284(-)
MRPFIGCNEVSFDSHDIFLRFPFAEVVSPSGVAGGADLRRLERPRRPARPAGAASEESCNMLANRLWASNILSSFGDCAAECEVLQLAAGEGKLAELPRELIRELRSGELR